jgi:hypothetical protein
MKFNLKQSLSYLPFIVYLIVIILTMKANTYSYLTVFFTLILLFSMGFCFTHKKFIKFGYSSLIIFIVWYLIRGYYEHFRWFSPIFGILVFMLNYLFNKYEK